MQNLKLEERKKIAESVRKQLVEERKKSSEKNKTELIKEIDDKIASLDDIYQLNEAE